MAGRRHPVPIHHHAASQKIKPSGKQARFPDGKLITMLSSGKTGRFTDGKLISMLSSGKTSEIPDGNLISMLSSGKTDQVQEYVFKHQSMKDELSALL